MAISTYFLLVIDMEIGRHGSPFSGGMSLSEVFLLSFGEEQRQFLTANDNDKSVQMFSRQIFIDNEILFKIEHF